MSLDIKYIKDNEGNNFFPLVHEKGVVDDNGTTLESKLQSKQDAIGDIDTIRNKANSAIQSITVGTTTTGEAGSSANVTNTGTATEPVLSFTIPQGAQGIQGIQGPQGERGPQGDTGVTVESVNSIIHSIDPTATYAAADVAGADAVQDVLSEVTELAGKLALGAVYDVSAENPTAGPNSDGKWETLSTLLSDANLNTLIPTALRKGGMSIKFIQSSDNKYVQYRSLTPTFETTPSCWEKETISVIEDKFKAQNYTAGKRIKSPLTIVEDENWGVSDFIELGDFTSLIAHFGQAAGSDAVIAFYDSNKSFLDSKQATEIDREILKSSINNSDRIKYCRLSFLLSYGAAGVEINGCYIWIPKEDGEVVDLQKNVESLKTNVESLKTYINSADSEPIARSLNLVKSGGVSKSLLNNYFIGAGSTTGNVWINLMRGRIYKLVFDNPDWARDNTGTDPTQWYFYVECKVDGTRRNLIYVQRGGTVNKTYEFTVPNDYDEGSLFVGGRANTGVKVLFNLYDITELTENIAAITAITCENIFKNNVYIDISHQYVSNNDWYVGILIPVTEGDTLTFNTPDDITNNSAPKIGCYNSEKVLYDYVSMSNNRHITVKSGWEYAAMSVRKADEEKFKLYKNGVLVFRGAYNDNSIPVLDKRLDSVEESVSQNAKDIAAITGDIVYKDNYYFTAKTEVSDNEWYEGKLIPYKLLRIYTIECPDDINYDSPQVIRGFNANLVITDYKGYLNGRTLSGFANNTAYMSFSIRKADAEKFKLYEDGELIYQGDFDINNIPALATRISGLEEQLDVKHTVYSRNKDKLPLLFASSNKNNRLQILIATDAHEGWGTLQNAVDFVNNCPNIQALFVMGDCTGQAFASLSTFERYNEIINSCTKPVLCVAGNHDCGYDKRLRYTALEDKICEYVTEPTYQHLASTEYTAGKAYYYHDFTTQKIRVIVLYEYDETISLVSNAYWEAVAYDSTANDYTLGTEYAVDDIVNFGLYTANSFKCIQAHTASADNEIRLQGYRGYRFIGQSQMAWLVATMLNTPADYNIIICTHIPASAEYNSIYRNNKFCSKYLVDGNSFNGMADDYLGILANAFNTGASGTMRVAGKGTFAYMNTQSQDGQSFAYDVPYNFSGKNSGTKFMCFLAGHTHVDFVFKNAYNQYCVSPTFTTATTRQFNTNDVPRSSNPDDLAYDALTAVAFDTVNNGIILTRVGTTATTDGYLRDVDRIDLTQ